MFSKKWCYATLIRAIRTFAESALAYIGTGAFVLGDVNWLGVLSAGAFGFVVAVLFALKGLPEVKPDSDKKEEEKEPEIRIVRVSEDELPDDREGHIVFLNNEE